MATEKPESTGTDTATVSGGPIPQPAKTPSSAGGAASAEQAAVTKVQIEQAPPAPDVLYPGEDVAAQADREHVRAEYKPFTW